ncbi:inositol kinase kinase [Niveomyces insectorum RCEF 264]|uniref:non-specific serine/threonine protein kinase n=1 Tax=Niveomyces insectorum RCEF 264 TaxID=1081102 RepID=A0A167UJW7_9HYPO|nr:inositol kinase kinase [Niveomyces insectorum RCEF 264]
MSLLFHNASQQVGGGGSGEAARSPVAGRQLDEDPLDDRERNPKRRKTDSMAPVSIVNNLRGRICEEFGVEMGGSLRETLTNMCEKFQAQNELQDEQTTFSVLCYLSQGLCAIDHTAALADPNDDRSALVCSHCRFHNPRPTPNRRKEKEKEDVLCVFGLFESVITAHVPPTGSLTVRALILLRRMALHGETKEVLDYEYSTLCKWCSAQLYSPDKAVRVQATVLAEDELEPIIRGLLRQLDSDYMPIRDLAISEIRYLASWFSRTPMDIFEPYWRTTAYLVVKHVADRPAVAAAVANLLGMTTPELALRLQSYAIPQLLFEKQLAPIYKIAEFRGEGDEVWHTVIDKATLPSILAFWVQLPAHVATLHDLMQTLQDFSARMGPTSIRDILGASSIPVLAELFIRLTYDVGQLPDQFEKVSDGIGFTPILAIARLLKDPQGQSDEELVTSFLSQHVLGLTAQLSDVRVHDGKKDPCYWINGIVTSFLLDALCNDATEDAPCWRNRVRRAAISCWSTLVQNVGDNNVKMLLETTFAVIRTNWDQFGDREKATCRDLLAWLLAKPDGRSHRDCLLEKIDVLPRLRIPELQKSVDNKIEKLRKPLGVMQTIDLFAQRITHENLDVVGVALDDAIDFLQNNQDLLQAPAQGEKSDSAVAHFVRALLDCSAKYNTPEPLLSSKCLACIGLVGCLDANRLGAVEKEPPFVVVWNFADDGENMDFAMYMLQHILTRAFLSATNSTSQGLIAYAVQTMMMRCGISNAVCHPSAETQETHNKWKALPELVQAVLSPLLMSKYHIAPPGPVHARYPVFRPGRRYGEWLRLLVVSLLAKPQTSFGETLFQSLARASKGLDLAIAEFLLPYMVVSVITGTRSTERDRSRLTLDLQRTAQYQPPDEAPALEREEAKLFYDAVFRVIEYAMIWRRSSLHSDQRQGVAQLEAFLEAFPAELLSQQALYCKDYARAMFFLEPVAMTKVSDDDDADAEERVRRDKAELDMIDIYAQIDDPDCLSGIMSKVGSLVEMNTYRKALLEQKAGRWESATTWHLSDLSAEPDNVDIQARVLKCLLEAGHHDALLARVDNLNLDEASAPTIKKVLPFAVEAAWVTFQWQKLEALVPVYKGDVCDIFNVGIARALSLLKKDDMDGFGLTLDNIVGRVSSSMSYSTTTSLQACHEAMLKAHVVTDLRIIGSAAAAAASEAQGDAAMERRSSGQGPKRTQVVLATLTQRLDLLEDVSDKRYVLGLQRAAMEALRPLYGDLEISALWLLSARLARKTGSNSECLRAIAQARRLGDPAADIENARRQWAWGGRHQAIADLRTAIRRGLPGKDEANGEGGGGGGGERARESNKRATTAAQAQGGPPLVARAGLLLTRWIDASGETSLMDLRMEYQKLAAGYNKWEKTHYFLGRHYKKVLESEQALRPDEQSDVFLTGELARLEIENYMRAAQFGTKYLHTTLPRFLTLWLSLAAQINKMSDGNLVVSDELRRRREDVLNRLHKRLQKHVERLPPFIFYTALPQLVARINHPNRNACAVLDQIIVKVALAYPQQALWSVFGVLTARGPATSKGGGGGSSSNQALAKRAAERLLQAMAKTPGHPVSAAGVKLPSLKSLLWAGVQLADELVKVGRKGNYRATNASKAVSLQRDMGFRLANHPYHFVVPIGRCLTAALPGRRVTAAGTTTTGTAAGTAATTASELRTTTATSIASPAVSMSGSVDSSHISVAAAVSSHNAFASDVITIQGFEDEVLILGSLAQPRKLTVRGSDGRLYDLLLKPKDDMRTDQRIMEVNALINQGLRKDTEAMRRQLSVRTYAVTPLNEDCGIIEWVLGLKTLREIVRPFYDRRRAHVHPRPPDPLEIAKLLNEAGAGGSAAAMERRTHLFTTHILPAFPPVLPEWFMRRFPAPAAWFAARLRFTRSAAVMSMVGAVLGLGDRHCENLLVDAGSGGVMHVDFNCLFEKGRLFTQPETVPFRLTQNMRAAMGLCDHRGPFQRSCELTLRLLRVQEETLLAVLEAFIYDPTLDLQVDPRGGQQQAAQANHHNNKKPAPVVKLDPQSVVKNIQRRINGLLFEETIPLGVEGQAGELIKQATDPVNLSAMYIGWSPHW